MIDLTPDEASQELSPSIDLTMQSVAHVYTDAAVGIVLSGMGHDGVQGMTAIKAAGGRTIVQDASALIFGMPKAVIDHGVADQVLPAPDIVKAMRESVATRVERR